MMEWVQTILLIILVDRNLILRARYKFAIEHDLPDRYRVGYFAIWIYCKKAQSEFYGRDMGKRLFYFRYGKRKP